MTETPKQKKPEIWNPGLDVVKSDTKDEKSEPTLVPSPLMVNPIFNYLHMMALVQQQQSQQNLQNGHQKQQVPPFLQLLQANQALNSRGLRPTINSVQYNKPPSNRKPKAPKHTSQPLSSSTSNPIVESVLSNSSGPVNYNCCAICGTSFRLTTDLVAHMRTNHRQSRYKRKVADNED